MNSTGLNALNAMHQETRNELGVLWLADQRDDARENGDAFASVLMVVDD